MLAMLRMTDKNPRPQYEAYSIGDAKTSLLPLANIRELAAHKTDLISKFASILAICNSEYHLLVPQ